MIRDLVSLIDEPIDEAIMAHGFSFSALTVDHGGAALCYAQAGPTGEWRLMIHSSTEGAPCLFLELGNEAKPSLRLHLVPDGRAVATLAEALGAAMTLFNSLDQSAMTLDRRE